MCFLRVYNGLTIYPIQCVRACDFLLCVSVYKRDRERERVCVHAWMSVCVIECEYWLGGIVLSRGHLSPAGPLALQLFRMCHRSLSQTGTQTHTHTHGHMMTTVADKLSLTLEVKGGSAALYSLIC